MTEKKKPGSSSSKKVKNTETVHHEQRRKRKKKPEGVKDLNLTAMLDVCFQLLIFFVLTVNFTVDEGYIRADLPKGGTNPQPKKEPPKTKTKIILKAVDIEEVEIAIQKPPKSFEGDDKFEQLFVELRGMGPQGNGLLTADSPMIIAPVEDVRWTHVVAAFNACLRAKYEDIRFHEPTPKP